MLFSDPRPEKFIGSWKGHFVLGGGPTDVVYTFAKDGTYDQDSYDPKGNKTFQLDGRWGHRRGTMSLSSQFGPEKATITWINDNEFQYRITAQDRTDQIGMTTTFRRQ